MPKRTPKPGSSPARAPVSVEHETLGLERVLFFSDAVFAIAITILVLDIRLPAGEQALNDAQLLGQLLGIWHKYFAYVLSFLVIGTFWISHHRKFRFIRRYDNNLLMLNLLFLMAIAFVPFPSSVLSEYGNLTSTIFYALAIIVSGLLAVALWWYATWRNRFTDAQMDAGRRQQEFLAPLLTVSVFSLSIGIAFINPGLARLFWLLVFPSLFYLRRKMQVA